MATTQLTRGGGLPPLAVLLFVFLVSGATAEDRTGTASWVGAPDGAGNDNGSCGFGDTVTVPPFSSMVTGVANIEECGMCYEVRCTGHPACWTQGVRVTVTDSCRSALCAEPNKRHFDMSGHAFGAMARPGLAAELRAAGNVTVVFEEADCKYTPPSSMGPSIKFPFVKIDPSATKENFTVTLIYTEGWAYWDKMTVRLETARGKIVMRHSHGATWYYHNPTNVSVIDDKTPMSMNIYSPSLRDPKSRMRPVFLRNVIPRGWKAGGVYFTFFS